jgi:hypothetical protein
MQRGRMNRQNVSRARAVTQGRPEAPARRWKHREVLRPERREQIRTRGSQMMNGTMLTPPCP